MSRIHILLLLMIAGLLLSGCRTTTIRQTPTVKTIDVNKPFVFKVKNGKVTFALSNFTAQEIFEKGTAAFQKGHYKQAKRYFQYIVTKHPKSSYKLYALYNLSLTHENLKQFKDATTLYSKLITKHPKTQEAENARFRMGACFLSMKRWDKAEDAYRVVLDTAKGLDVTEKLEVLASLGLAMFHQKKDLIAEETFRRAVRLFQKASRKEYLGSDQFAAMSQHYIGRIYDRKFRERKFRLRKDLMMADLNDKAVNLLKAQAHYIRAIRIRHSEWLVASLFKIGDMYNQMYTDMVNAPIPKDLDTKALQQLYQKQLKKRIRVLLTKAMMAYEKNLQAAENLGVNQSSWVAQTRKRLLKLRQYMVKEFLSEPAEKAPATKAKSRVSAKNNTAQPKAPAPRASSGTPTRLPSSSRRRAETPPKFRESISR